MDENGYKCIKGGQKATTINFSCCQFTAAAVAAAWQLRGTEMPKIITTQEGAHEAYK